MHNIKKLITFHIQLRRKVTAISAYTSFYISVFIQICTNIHALRRDSSGFLFSHLRGIMNFTLAYINIDGATPLFSVGTTYPILWMHPFSVSHQCSHPLADGSVSGFATLKDTVVRIFVQVSICLSSCLPSLRIVEILNIFKD